MNNGKGKTISIAIFFTTMLLFSTFSIFQVSKTNDAESNNNQLKKPKMPARIKSTPRARQK